MQVSNEQHTANSDSTRVHTDESLSALCPLGAPCARAQPTRLLVRDGLEQFDGARLDERVLRFAQSRWRRERRGHFCEQVRAHERRAVGALGDHVARAGRRRLQILAAVQRLKHAAQGRPDRNANGPDREKKKQIEHRERADAAVSDN